MSDPLHLWRAQPASYDFCRPFPARHVVRLFAGQSVTAIHPERAVRLYEPGGGTGRIAIPLALAFPHWQFEVSDAHAGMLDVLLDRRVCEGLDNVKAVLADVREYRPTAPNLIIVSSLLHLVPEWQDLLTRLTELLLPGGLVALVGEEADLYNAALSRTPVLLSGPPDPVLAGFWQAYTATRQELGVPVPTRVEVGCLWDAMNQPGAEALTRAGLAECEGVEVRWTQCLTGRDIRRIIAARSYSSMFGLTDEQVEGILAGVTGIPPADEDPPVCSRHVAIARFFQRGT